MIKLTFTFISLIIIVVSGACWKWDNLLHQGIKTP